MFFVYCQNTNFLIACGLSIIVVLSYHDSRISGFSKIILSFSLLVGLFIVFLIFLRVQILCAQEMGPFLIFCSEADKLAPYRSVCNSAQTLADLGGDVRFVKWSSSHHIGTCQSSLLDFI